MKLNSHLEHKFSWLAFPGLIRAIVMLQCVVFALILVKPETASFFIVTPEGLLKGEYWRLVAWVFYPLVAPYDGPYGTLMNVIFLMFITRIAFLFSDSLEHAWGEVRTSFYVYSTLICQIIILYFIPFPGLGSQMLYLAIFFAFATLFPHHEFLLFLVLPVKVWILAAMSAAGLFLQAVQIPFLFTLYAISLLPYLVWALPRMRHWGKQRKKIAARRSDYQEKIKGGPVLFHECAICKRTEVDNPNLDFRVASDGKEYCLDHLDEDGKPRPS